MQTSYSRDFAIGQKGQLADSSFHHIVSLLGKEDIGIGLGLAKFKGEDNVARLPQINIISLQADADLVTSNSTVASVTIQVFGGSEVVNTTSATVFATDHATTMAAIAAKIAAFTGISSCTVTDANSRTLYIVAEDNVQISDAEATTTLGGSQAAWTATNDSGDELYAIAATGHDIEQTYPPNKLTVSTITITLDADFVASNVLAGYINGTAISITYASSHANTMNLLKAAVEAITGIKNATVSGRVLTVNAFAGYNIRYSTFAITGGSSQATVTLANATSQTGGLVQYDEGEMIPGLRRGRVYVEVEQAVDSDDTVYVRFEANSNGEPGGFRKDADTNTAIAWTGAKYVTSASAGGIAEIELNLP